MPAWEDRDEWLSLLEELFDPATIERLERVDVGPGWEALEVGAGRGSIAGWLAHRVGPSGRVVASDLDTGLLEELDGVEVVRHDVLTDDFPEASFDLIHCRAVLVHVLSPGRALRRMVTWLKPGGVLLAEEPWLDAGRLSPDRTAALMAGALAAQMDGAFARSLPQALREAQLERVEVDAPLVLFEGGTRLANFFRLALEGAAEPLVEAGQMPSELVDAMSARFMDPAWSDFGWPRIAAWGWKPQVPRA